MNRGVRDLVIAHGGKSLWDDVRQRAGVDTDDFSSMAAYDDAVTMALVAAASDIMDTPADDLLRQFGHHWVQFTGKEGYGPLMDLSGDSMVEFLLNLDQMHARIKMSMPELNPPQFSCEQGNDDSITVEYYSDRDGLAAMVIGLFEGLAQRFGEQAIVKHVSAKSGPDVPDVFEIEVKAA
ncbi:MAG: heme NO-binding domain-containing protein [Pseudomonadota bacterium]